MKCIITSGGRGTRLRPLTHTYNKHLIPIANKPMIHYAIEAVVEAGITDIGIVVNPDTGHDITQSLGTGEFWGVRFTYIMQQAPLGLAHVLKVCQDFLKDEPFVYYLGDNFLVGGITRFLQQFDERHPNCLLVLAKVPDPERFGVPTIHHGRIVRVDEKPRFPESPYAVTGIYMYDHHIWEAIHGIMPSARGELEISDAHQYLIERGYRVDFCEVTGWWKDTGKPEDLLEANCLALDRLIAPGQSRLLGDVDAASEITGKVVVEAGARVRHSKIRGPAIIGPDTIIDHSYVGPFTAIASGCEIRNSEIEYSIVLGRVKVLDVHGRIEHSLLGQEVEIVRCIEKPHAQKFIIGDQSRVELI